MKETSEKFPWLPENNQPPKSMYTLTSNTRALIAFGLPLSIASLANAQFSDSYDYADGTDYVNNGGYVGDVSAGQFNATGLDSPLLTGESGGRLSMIGERIKHTIGDSFGDEDETIYISYLFQADSNSFDNGGSFFAMELHQEPDPITSGDSNRTYNIGLLRANGNTSSAQFEHNVDTGEGATVTSGDTSPDLGAFNTGDNLLVMRFDFTNGGQDYEINAWLNPANEGVVTGTNATIAGSGLDFNTFGYAAYVNSTDNANYDEIRFSATASGLGLASIPEPSAYVAMIGLASLGCVLYRRKKA